MLSSTSRSWNTANKKRETLWCRPRRPLHSSPSCISDGDNLLRNDSPGYDKAGKPEGDASSTISSAMHFNLTEVAKLQGRGSNRTNLFLVNDSEESWRRLDKKVNKYPIQRSFTGIGPGDPEFRKSILQAVESVVGPVHVECMSQRASSKGAYLSVTVGPVWIESCDQVIQIYGNLKEVSGIKWII
ncbi:hypothetical protein CEUSTIGMA_g5695.t1 [Chlamydomonas eustigma]|uniref:Uncharacterized protein n=1 Tax=Chlamydomonas eustigma TaxID=1157962 RepID=A0A250X5A5_9CHLO|nr:hypothetical protein CEUSTIGMA_g5695.t1 [Chlamydomonas eustigma]|eukprot:GAX78253.1 hypothetical protein CEUSTIGMA_g5695.t1 [Chlamydomonas eustigma]